MIKTLLICTAIIVCGIEYGGKAYDAMSASIAADMSHKIQLMQDARGIK